jgi:ParB-like chromosome segregation protein Spo0J
MKKNNLEIKYLTKDEIKPYDKNCRIHSDEQIKQIKKSMQEFGVCTPIGLANGEIVFGHGRFESMVQLGYEKFPVVDLSHLSQAQIKAYRIADNRLQDLSEFDEELLKAELEVLQDEFNFDIELMGFDLDFLDDDEIEEDTKEVSSSDGVLVVVGRYKIEISQSKYDKWIEKINKKVGSDEESIKAEILKRLGL